jgi:hypothetical protein
MRLLELGHVAVKVGPLVLLGMKVPLEPEGINAAEDDETGEADAEADSEEASAGVEEGEGVKVMYETAKAGTCPCQGGSTGSAWDEAPV